MIQQPKDIPHGVTVEICSACNRRCEWCPQCKSPRQMELLSLSLIEKVANELAQVGYKDPFGFHLYNEPLMDKRFPAIVKMVRGILTQSNLYIHTNGDFLTTERWTEIRQAGLDNVQVNQYDDPDAPGAFEGTVSEQLNWGVDMLLSDLSTLRDAQPKDGLMEKRDIPKTKYEKGPPPSHFVGY